MNADGTKRDNIDIGMSVSVNPQNDKTRKTLIDGNVEEILTNADTHPHGILVRLNDGTVGRVKKILSNKPSSNTEASDNGDEESRLPDLIEKGENHFIEFKTSILWSKYKTKEDIESSNSFELKKYGQNTSKYIIAKSICGFLNSEGGSLIIGVKEVNDSDETIVVGIESEYGKLRDKTQDGYRRMILDEVIKPYLPPQVFNHFNDYLKFKFEKIDEKTILGITIKPSDFRVFVSIANQDIFFVRIDASTRQLSGPALVDFCSRRFK